MVMNLFGKRKRFDDFFIDIEKLEKMMDDMMQDAFFGEDDEERIKMSKPLVMGFSLKIGPNGKPIMEQFGNIKPDEQGAVVSAAREPLVDFVKRDNEFIITAELPGVERREIKLRPDKNNLILEVEHPEKAYYKKIALGEPISKESIKANFKNGILEISIARKHKPKPEDKDLVKID